MNDSTIEIISLLSIILGIILGFFLIFDYTPADAFFLEKNDNNAYIDGFIIQKNERENFTTLKIYGCRSFDAYFETGIDKGVNDSIIVTGSFVDNFFVIEKYS
jgi:hypothetical protein